MKPTATQRTLYTPGTRKRKVWDAACNQACACEATAPTKPKAIEEVKALHAYRAQAPAPIVAGGCSLGTTAPNEWWFQMRVGTPRCSSCGFGAPSQADAIATVIKWYADHEDVKAFISEVAP